MISEQSYNELKRFRDYPAQYEYPPSDRLCMLQNEGLLQLLSCRWDERVDGVEVTSLKYLGLITELGRDALSEFENVRRKESKDERQRRFQNKVSVAQVLVPTVTFVLGLLVEHYASIFGMFGRWIENIIH